MQLSLVPRSIKNNAPLPSGSSAATSVLKRCLNGTVGRGEEVAPAPDAALPSLRVQDP